MSEYKVNGSEGAREGAWPCIEKRTVIFILALAGLFWKGFSPAACSCFFTLLCSFCGRGSLT